MCAVRTIAGAARLLLRGSLWSRALNCALEQSELRIIPMRAHREVALLSNYEGRVGPRKLTLATAIYCGEFIS